MYMRFNYNIKYSIYNIISRIKTFYHFQFIFKCVKIQHGQYNKPSRAKMLYSIRRKAPSFNISVGNCTPTKKRKWSPPPIEMGGHLSFSYILDKQCAIIVLCAFQNSSAPFLYDNIQIIYSKLDNIISHYAYFFKFLFIGSAIRERHQIKCK